jgi:hypothetical protein
MKTATALSVIIGKKATVACQKKPLGQIKIFDTL